MAKTGKEDRRERRVAVWMRIHERLQRSEEGWQPDLPLPALEAGPARLSA